MYANSMKIEVGNHYLAFVLDEASRERLLKEFAPMHERVRCHHVTIAYEIAKDDVVSLQKLVDSDPNPSVSVVSYVDADGIDLFGIAVQGTTKRLDGNHYHLTHSFRKGRSAKDSNLFFSNEIEGHQQVFGAAIRLTGKFELISKEFIPRK
jgi:hypothetical protein